MKAKKVGQSVFVVNPEDNGGEALLICTDIMWNGDEPRNDRNDYIWLNQTIVLQSYLNSASLNLIGAPLTPKKLRAMADNLEKAIEEARVEVRELLDTNERLLARGVINE